MEYKDSRQHQPGGNICRRRCDHRTGHGCKGTGPVSYTHLDSDRYDGIRQRGPGRIPQDRGRGTLHTGGPGAGKYFGHQRGTSGFWKHCLQKHLLLSLIHI